jgi:hypothetical protein
VLAFFSYQPGCEGFSVELSTEFRVPVRFRLHNKGYCSRDRVVI